MSNPQITMSDLTVEFADYVTQFTAALSNQPAWVGTLDTTTSQTLIQLSASVGAYTAGRINRVYEDAFPETAVSDQAIYSAAQMQGLRLARCSPASVTVNLSSPVNITIPSYTQFNVGSYYYFNRQAISLIENVTQAVSLFEGQMKAYTTPGLGTNLQAWVSPEDSYTVADQDVTVAINSVIIPKAFGGLWNYANVPAYSDLTMSDGRLLIQFGNNQFGSVPNVTDTVLIIYPITQGLNGNNQNILNQTCSMAGFPQIQGPVVTSPTGGANQQSSLAYKNLASGSFGTYSSAVTPSQYKSLVGTYPGVVDAITQAQREINPNDLTWMNVIRITALTSSTWTPAQRQEFLNYMQSVTMYAPYFVWQDPIQILNNVNIDIYCFNTVVLGDIENASIAAIQQLFAPQPGILMTNFYPSDIEDAVKTASPGLISYVIINEPTGPMRVTAPPSPQCTLEAIAGSGSLGALVYSYGVASVYENGEVGAPTNWGFINITGTTAIYGINVTWPNDPNAVAYRIYGRSASNLGLLAIVSAPPSSVSSAVATTGGVLAAGTYQYQVSAILASGETVASNIEYAITTGTTSSIELAWPAVSGALSYNVYGRTQNDYGLIINVSGTSYLDTGAVSPTTQQPIVNNGTYSWLDNGSISPTGGPPNTIANVPIQYNALGNLTVNVHYSERQQRNSNTPYRGNS